MDDHRRPLIGITTPSDRDASSSSLAATRAAYLAAVSRAGGLPVMLKPAGSRASPSTLLERLDGILFTGGRDVDPRLYGEAPLNQSVRVDDERDAFELPLIREAVARDLPVLAICRGCQVLGVALGGGLWQDLPAQLPHALEHAQSASRESVTHDVQVDRRSLLAQVIGDLGGRGLPANSFHHQALRDVPPALDSAAFAADGIVEAVEAPKHRFVVGVQWHPEHLAAAWPVHQRLFDALVEAARQRRPRASRDSATAILSEKDR
jgi:putative glutamine amidotransferase